LKKSEVISLYQGEVVELINNLFNRKAISCNTTHPQSSNLQAKLMGEKLKG